MLNEQGYVAECTGDNIFIIRDGVVHTPLISDGALNGITRATIIDLARESGIQVVERSLTRYDLFIADECFLTGTAAEVIPVVALDRRKIGTGTPGPLTRRFIEAYRHLVNTIGTPFR
jgi:branched-chain amino acid aminotransferase